MGFIAGATPIFGSNKRLPTRKLALLPRQPSAGPPDSARGRYRPKVPSAKRLRASAQHILILRVSRAVFITVSSIRNIARFQCSRRHPPTQDFSPVTIGKSGERENELLGLLPQVAGADRARQLCCDHIWTRAGGCPTAGLLPASVGRQQDQAGRLHHLRQCPPAPR